MPEALPFFSIILPAYNRADTIDVPVRSVLRQTFIDWELIFVDDGSTDDTKLKMTGYLTDQRIKYFYQSNKERSSARNTGIEKACGKYICFIDSDDEYLEDHLTVFYDKIMSDDKNDQLLFTKTLIKSTGGELSVKPVPSINSLNKFAFLMHYTFTPINVCIDKNILKKNKFDERLNFGEDLDLWLRIAAEGYRLVEIDHATAIYHADEDMFGRHAPQYRKSYKFIFARPELKSLLPCGKKNMLFSKCFFFQSLTYEKERSLLKMYISIIKSFVMFPRGYNNKTNKILLVLFLYNIPVIGEFMRFVKTKFIPKESGKNQ